MHSADFPPPARFDFAVNTIRGTLATFEVVIATYQTGRVLVQGKQSIVTYNDIQTRHA